jgi:hypothetical protein
MNKESRAPRFRAYLHRSTGAIFMRRLDWEQLVGDQVHIIEIDISYTPLGAVARKVKIVGSFAERTQDGQVNITIFREDLKDAPNIFNRDDYEIWEQFDTHMDYQKVVTSASTSDDSALRSFLDDYVFIVPIEKGIGHHLPDMPAVYKAILENGKRTN